MRSGWSHGFSLVSLISNLGGALGVVGGKIVEAISEDVVIQLIPESVSVFHSTDRAGRIFLPRESNPS